MKYLLLPILFLCVSLTQLHAQIVENQLYKITVKSSGNVLDVAGANQDDKATILGYGYNGGRHQHFYLIKRSSTYYSIGIRHSRKVLEVSTPTNGGKVYQNEYHGGNNQLFRLVDKGDGYYHIINKQTRNALEMKKDQSSLVHFPAHTGSSQLFKLEKVIDVSVPNVGEARFTGNLKFEMIGERVWVENANGKTAALYEETKRTAKRIFLQDRDRGVNIELNIDNKTMEQNGKRIRSITGLSPRQVEYRKLYRVMLLGQTLFAYYSDNVYGYYAKDGKRKANVPGCSGSGGDTYKEVFFSACEEHDRYWRAPWKEAGFGRNYALNVTNHLFLSHMNTICDDTGDIFSEGACRIGSGIWQTAVQDFGNMTEMQEHEEWVDENSKSDYRVIKYVMPLRRSQPLYDQRKAIGFGTPYTVGNEYEVSIDFSGAGDNKYSDTESLISVEFFDQYDISLGYECSYGISYGSEKTMSVYLTETPAYFVISNHGNDAFYMDAVTMRDVKRGKSQGHGVNGGSGWCVSRQTTDSVRAAAGNKKVSCYPGIKFSATGTGTWTAAAKTWDFPAGIGPLTD